MVRSAGAMPRAMHERDTARRCGLAADGPVFGDPVLVKYRLGQGAFRVLVADLYERRCAVTGERTLAVVQATHLRSLAHAGTHRSSTGPLLRPGIHTLVDRGYVTITPDRRFQFGRPLKKDSDDGEEYRKLSGLEIRVPGSV